MRAMMNPTRMSTLSELAEKLALRIVPLCPLCNTPGFGFKSTAKHLPCSWCGAKTKMHRFEVWGCIRCAHEEPLPRKDQQTKADPTFCDYCNP